MAQFKVILFLLLGLVVVVIIVQNDDAMSTAVTFRFNPMISEERTISDTSIYTIVVITFLLGVILTGLYDIVERLRLKKRIKGLTKELQNKEKELNSLRNLPITSDDVGAPKTGSA